jgi:hypothetical protein
VDLAVAGVLILSWRGWLRCGGWSFRRHSSLERGRQHTRPQRDNFRPDTDKISVAATLDAEEEHYAGGYEVMGDGATKKAPASSVDTRTPEAKDESQTQARLRKTDKKRTMGPFNRFQPRCVPFCREVSRVASRRTKLLKKTR